MKKCRSTSPLCLLVFPLLLSGCTFSKIVWHNFSGIEDYRIFPHRDLQASTSPFRFVENVQASRIPATIDVGGHHGQSLDALIKANDTVAFLIIRNDTLLFERYYDGYADSSLSLSFSMAKSFLSILMGCAVDDGYIGSVEQPVTDFVPELEKTGFKKVKLKHLLQMTSGMDYAESDNPFGLHPRFYYGSNLEARLVKLKLKEEPGHEFIYKSGENQLLGLILSRALKTKTITAYLQERIWEPLGMEYGGRWSLDHDGNGLEKTFCCLSARARDFAKLGRLYLHQGNWNGRQIVSRQWVEQSTAVDTTEGSAWNYQYQWWLVSREHGDYMAAGHLGQYVYINPEKQMIIVRLGTGKGDLSWDDWKELFGFISAGIR